MGDGSRARIRRARARHETGVLLQPLFDQDIYIDGVIQCGLGDWAEGPVLLEKFSTQRFLAVEPVHRYCLEAWRDGFRGPIIQAALWSETGVWFELNDFRSRTSILDKERRYLGHFKVQSITLDNAVEYVKYWSTATLLWMDCEGVEPQILQGAKKTLENVKAIVCELKDKPRFPGWAVADEMIRVMGSLGFGLELRVTDNGLFLRNR